MIKKLLMMSSGVVLGSMITTASFAWPASDDCRDAREEHGAIMDALKACKNGTTNWRLWCEEITDIRVCKNGSLAVVREVCPHGSYGEEGVPERYVCEALVEPGRCVSWELFLDDELNRWESYGRYRDKVMCEWEGVDLLEVVGIWGYECRCYRYAS